MPGSLEYSLLEPCYLAVWEPGRPLGEQLKPPAFTPQLGAELTASAHLPALGGDGLGVFLAGPDLLG